LWRRLINENVRYEHSEKVESTDRQHQVAVGIRAALPTLLVVGLLTAAQAATLAWDANGTTVAQTDGAAAWLAADLWWTGSANTT